MISHPHLRNHATPQTETLMLYTCLGIEWLTQGGVVYYFCMFIRPHPYTCLGHWFGN